ncbi:hypothetical protein K1719_039769 [Acacia pycnantha]|nr:hypothetical protein K1719_039769 [Acacia pycnantha]
MSSISLSSSVILPPTRILLHPTHNEHDNNTRNGTFLLSPPSSLYSFFAERSKEGKADTWSVVSSVAFALTFLCLSRQIKPDFDVGLCGFFLGHVTGQLMKIHLIFILVAASFCYPLVVLESYSESTSRNGDSSAPLNSIRIDSRNRESLGVGQGGPSSDPGNKSLEKLPKATEQFLPNLQELKRSQPPPPPPLPPLWSPPPPLTLRRRPRLVLPDGTYLPPDADLGHLNIMHDGLGNWMHFASPKEKKDG